jgi:hypothetical protein
MNAIEKVTDLILNDGANIKDNDFTKGAPKKPGELSLPDPPPAPEIPSDLTDDEKEDIMNKYMNEINATMQPVIDQHMAELDIYNMKMNEHKAKFLDIYLKEWLKEYLNNVTVVIKQGEIVITSPAAPTIPLGTNMEDVKINLSL